MTNENLKLLMQSNKLSADQVAELVGLTPRQVYRLMSGTSKIRPSVAFMLNAKITAKKPRDDLGEST